MAGIKQDKTDWTGSPNRVVVPSGFARERWTTLDDDFGKGRARPELDRAPDGKR